MHGIVFPSGMGALYAAKAQVPTWDRSNQLARMGPPVLLTPITPSSEAPVSIRVTEPIGSVALVACGYTDVEIRINRTNATIDVFVEFLARESLV